MAIVIVMIHLIYLSLWYWINRLRNKSNSFIKEWDNGNDFYESLDKDDQATYWKEDIKILNLVFGMMLLVIEGTLYFLFQKNTIWISILLIGLFCSCSIGIVLSICLRKRLK